MSYSQNLPIRYDYYLAQAEDWATVFTSRALTNDTRILEVCTGWSPKIGLALARQKFAGSLILHDQDQTALQTSLSLIAPVQPLYTIATWSGDILQEACPPVDIIIMNHVLDDILLFSVLEPHNYSPYVDLGMLRQLWHTNFEQLRQKIPVIAHNLQHNLLTNLQPGGQIYLRQYPGYQEKLYELHEAIELTQLLQQEVCKFFLQQHMQLQKLPIKANVFTNTLQVWQKS